MAEVIKMPKMSDTMTEGVIANWLKKVGDKVKSGDVLAEVETDKATMELESYEDGTLLHIGPKKGDSVPIDSVIAVIGKEGEDISALLQGGSAPAPEATPAPEAPKDEAPEAKAAETKPAAATPAAKVNATVLRMPKMSDTMTAGTLANWLKKEGDKVKSGDVLAEVETDKATMELESYEDGTLLYLGAKPGESVPVDAVIAVIGEPGADFQSLLTSSAAPAEKSQGTASPVKEEAAKENAQTDEQVKTNAAAVGQPAAGTAPAPTGGQQTSDDSKGRVLASPLAKKLASEKGFDLAQISGSGENGRITRRDVEGFKPQAQPAAPTAQPQTAQVTPFTATGQEGSSDVQVSQMRKTIARRLAESKFSAPHFYLTMAINMDKAAAARESLNSLSPVKISFNDLVIKAAAAALRQHPGVNSSWLGDTIRTYQHIHIGVAVAVEEGLLVPVVRHADAKSLSQIAAEVKELGGKAKSKKLQLPEMQGNTFTISNLGMFGIEEFTAIINPPDACIMAVGAIQDVPVVRDGQVVPGKVMKVTLSCDHRVVDGSVGSAFLNTFKNLLEEPIRLLI
jgi:pyruvate dehydrogenase E2 component (dihydrolipoamide acetyltransferase)